MPVPFPVRALVACLLSVCPALAQDEAKVLAAFTKAFTPPPKGKATVEQKAAALAAQRLDGGEVLGAIAHQVDDHQIEAAAAQNGDRLAGAVGALRRRPVERRQAAVDRLEAVLPHGEQERPPNGGRGLIQFTRKRA